MSHNTLIHHIVRPTVRLIARSQVTPNQVTTARLATGLGAGAAFALGTQVWMAVGAGVFVVSMLLDRADGELARQSGQMSEAGHRYDLISDCLASIACFVGLGIGLSSLFGLVALWVGVVAAFGIGSLFFQLNVLKTAQVASHAFADGRITVDLDDTMIFVPVLIWCGLAWPMMIVAAVITPLASVGLAVLSMMRSLKRA